MRETASSANGRRSGEARGRLAALLAAAGILAAVTAPRAPAAGEEIPPALAAQISTVLVAPGALAPAAALRGPGTHPVRPTLVHAGEDAFRARDTLVPASVARRPEDGFTVATATGTLSVEPLDADPDARPGSIAVTGAGIVFPGVARQTDLLVRPAADGVETATTLRDARAPASRTWKLGLPGRERLVRTAAGAVQIVDPTPVARPREPASEAARAADAAAQAALAPLAAAALPELPREPVTGSGEVVAEIARPIAVDASGEHVPVRLEVRGDEVTMRVDERGVEFPVVAHPRFHVRAYRIAAVERQDLVAGSSCRRSFQRRVLESLLGTDLAWVKLKKHFCWNRPRRRVTYAEGVVEYDTTGAGSLAQWDIDEVTSRNERYFPWHGHARGGHQSLAAVRFKQSALGWGVDSATLTTEIRGRYNGSVRKR